MRNGERFQTVQIIFTIPVALDKGVDRVVSVFRFGAAKNRDLFEE